MPSQFILTLVGIACLLIVRVAALRLIMSPPDHVHVPTGNHSITFTCAADLALTGCQFRWWDDRIHKAGPLLDLSGGLRTLANTSYLNDDVTSYYYRGRGLEAGDCGVSLRVKGPKLYMVACRVQTESGGWTYAWTDFHADPYELLPHTLTPREFVVLPGGEARIALKAQEPLDRCRFNPPRLALDFEQGAQSADSTGWNRYLGVGLVGGECGLVLSDVIEANNGPVRCYMRHLAAHKNTDRLTVLIVALPPSAPTMSVVYTDASVTATCVVNEARPVANISWFLADVVVRQDSMDDSPSNPQDEWRWPWLQGSILQRFTLRRQTEDNGKVLKCVVSHVALHRPLEATEKISFTEPATTTPLATTYTTPAATRSTPATTSTTPATTLETQARAQIEQLALQTAQANTQAAQANAQAAESNAQIAMLALQTAQANAQADQTYAQARTRVEEAWAKNAEEALEVDRERRKITLLQLRGQC